MFYGCTVVGREADEANSTTEGFARVEPCVPFWWGIVALRIRPREKEPC